MNTTLIIQKVTSDVEGRKKWLEKKIEKYDGMMCSS
jgi:hypothetical protein